MSGGWSVAGGAWRVERGGWSVEVLRTFASKTTGSSAEDKRYALPGLTPFAGIVRPLGANTIRKLVVGWSPDQLTAPTAGLLSRASRRLQTFWGTQWQRSVSVPNSFVGPVHAPLRSTSTSRLTNFEAITLPTQPRPQVSSSGRSQPGDLRSGQWSGQETGPQLFVNASRFTLHASRFTLHAPPATRHSFAQLEICRLHAFAESVEAVLGRLEGVDIVDVGFFGDGQFLAPEGGVDDHSA